MRALWLSAGLGVVAALTVATVGPAPLASASGTTTPQVESPRLVTTGGNTNRLFLLPQVAVDPANPSTIVIADGDYRAGGCSLFVSTNGGLVWNNTTNSLLPSGYDACIVRPDTEPQVTPLFAPGGKTLYVAMDATSQATGQQHGPISLAFARTTDLGLTHSSVVAIKAGTISGTTTAGLVSRPAENRSATIAVDPSDPNRIYVGSETAPDSVGMSTNLAPTVPSVAVSNDNGLTWSAPVDLAKGAGQTPHPGYTPVLMVSKNGTVYAVAEGYSTGSSFPMELYKSTDHGVTWTASTIAGPEPSADEPAAAIDPTTDTLFAAWDQQTSAMTQNVFITRSTDGGRTWTKPASIVPSSVAAVSDRYFPGLSVAPNGRVDIDWYDFRNDPFHPTGTSEQYADVYYTYSSNQGATWAPDIRVTPRSIDENLGVTFPDFSVETNAIASSNDAALFAWPQPAPNEPGFQAEDDYFTRVDLSGAVTPTLPAAKSHDVLWGVAGGAIGLAVAGLVLLAIWATKRRSVT